MLAKAGESYQFPLAQAPTAFQFVGEVIDLPPKSEAEDGAVGLSASSNATFTFTVAAPIVALERILNFAESIVAPAGIVTPVNLRKV